MFKLRKSRNIINTNSKLRDKFEKLHLGTANYLNAKTGGWCKRQKCIFLSLILIGFFISITFILKNISDPTVVVPRAHMKPSLERLLPETAHKIPNPALTDTNHHFYHP